VESNLSYNAATLGLFLNFSKNKVFVDVLVVYWVIGVHNHLKEMDISALRDMFKVMRS
jgi:hypothetical protein